VGPSCHSYLSYEVSVSLAAKLNLGSSLVFLPFILDLFVKFPWLYKEQPVVASKISCNHFHQVQLPPLVVQLIIVGIQSA
jgi:hypothetical protein